MATDLAQLVGRTGPGALSTLPYPLNLLLGRQAATGPDFSNVVGGYQFRGGVDEPGLKVVPDFSNVQGGFQYMGGVDLNGVTGVLTGEDGPCISGSKRLADGRVVPCSPAEMGTAVVPAPVPAVMPTTVVSAPAPVVAVQPQPVESVSPAMQNTLCELGLCAPGGGRWAAGDGTTKWDRQMDALLMQRTGGIDAITQNDAAGRRLDVSDMRASPEWAAQYQAALVNTRGDSAAAEAVADRQMMALTPGASLGYAENLAGRNEQAVDNFRSELLGAAAYLNKPDVAAPAFGMTPGYSTGGIENFYADPITGLPVARIGGQSHALPEGMASFALGPELARAGVTGQLARSDAGQAAMAKLLQYEGQLANPVPLQQALLEIAQRAAKNPAGSAGGISPLNQKIIETRALQFAKDNPTWTPQQIIAAATTGVLPALPAAAAP